MNLTSLDVGKSGAAAMVIIAILLIFATVLIFSFWTT